MYVRALVRESVRGCVRALVCTCASVHVFVRVGGGGMVSRLRNSNFQTAVLDSIQFSYQNSISFFSKLHKISIDLIHTRAFCRIFFSCQKLPHCMTDSFVVAKL